jgi:hypothetical protein
MPVSRSAGWFPVLVALGVGVLVAGCGGSPSANGTSSTTTRPVPTAGHRQTQTLTQGGIRFDVPATWAVAHGTCRCPTDRSTATLDNGSETPGVLCFCPNFRRAAPRVVALYAGSTGTVPGGRPVRTRGGLTAQVSVDATTASTTAVFPASGDWILVGPVEPGSSRVRTAQIALEQEIVDSAAPA